MIERLRSFFSSNSTIGRVRDFLESHEYPPLVALGMFLCYVAEIEVPGIAFLILLSAFGVLISRSFKCVIPPLLIVPFSLPLGHTPGIPTYSDFYLQAWVIVLAVICGAALLSCVVMHYVLWGGARETFARPTCLTPYLIVLSVGLLLNGVGAPGHNVHDFLAGLSLVALWGLLYILILRKVRFDKSTMEYLARICQWLALLLVAELVYIVLTNNVIVDGVILKDQIIFGWGIQNNFAGILVWLLPPVFYLAATGKNGWIQLLLSVIMMGSIFFSMCRSALVVGALMYLVCLVSVCFIGQNKMLFRLFSAGCVLTALAMMIFFREPLLNAFRYYAERGFSDSGRFDLWRAAWQNFLDYPFLGAGFHATPFESWAGRTFGYCHNTVVQLFSAGGLVAGGTYLLMRARTIWMISYRITTERLFLGLSLAALLGVGLLDNHMFNVYPAFFYAIVVAFIEQDYLGCLKPGDENLLLTGVRRVKANWERKHSSEK